MLFTVFIVRNTQFEENAKPRLLISRVKITFKSPRVHKLNNDGITNETLPSSHINPLNN